MTVKEILIGSLGLSHAFIKHLKFIPDGICVDGKQVTVRAVLKAGQSLSLATEDEATCPALTPTDIPLCIVYEDEYITVPSKPPFMPTHPSHLHHGDTLADALAFRAKKRGTPFVFRPVNRLDRNTSGLTIVANDRISAATLAAHMREGRIYKQYVAILCGIPHEREGKIETYMRRTKESIIVRENCGESDGGDYALTYYRVLRTASYEGRSYSLVQAEPQTGRTHQLRVHFAGIGCPIAGDDMYGTSHPLIGRHALHAERLEFPHPKSGETLILTAPMWEDMQTLAEHIFDSAQKS